MKPLNGISYTCCIVLAGLYGNGVIFCVLQIMCQIAYLKYRQKIIFSCRGPQLRAPLSEQITFQQDVLMGRDGSDRWVSSAVGRDVL